ncbi:MAG: exosortase family protein XrtF [Bacteroidota bacterium]
MSVFQKNKPFFIFLLKFGGTYIVLSVFYWLYLNQYDAAANEVDGVTHLVARQSVAMARFLGEDATIMPHQTEASYRFFINQKALVRVVEGCNAVSVMILFVAFIVAFSSTAKRTLLYITSGLIILHILNVMRIALLSMGLYYYKEWGSVLHDVVFPLFIYGVVVVLWIAWVSKFRGNATK